MLARRLALVAFTASVVASSAFAAQPSTLASAGHALDSKDHTPVLEQCTAYRQEFTKAVAQQPASHKVREAQRLYREGVWLCDMQQTRATQGANDIAEALRLIGARPPLL